MNGVEFWYVKNFILQYCKVGNWLILIVKSVEQQIFNWKMVIFIRNFIVMCDFLFIILIIVVLFIVSCILEDFVLMEFGKIVFIGIVVFYNFVSDVEVFVVFYEDLNFGEMVWYRCFIDSLG